MLFMGAYLIPFLLLLMECPSMLKTLEPSADTLEYVYELIVALVFFA